MTPQFPYKQLGGRSPGFITTHTLWLGPDHLLAVRNRRFIESYTRYSLRDIQGIVVQKRRRFRMPVYLALGIMVLLIVAGVGAARKAFWLQGLGWAGIAALVGYWIIVSLFFSSSVYLKTAVSWKEMPSLCRIWTARRVLLMLEESIAAAQGVLPADWEANEPPSASSSEAQHIESGAKSAPGLTIPLATVAAFFADAIVSWLVKDHSTLALRITGVCLTLLAVALPIASIIESRADRRFEYLRKLFYVAFIIIAVVNIGNSWILNMLGVAPAVLANGFMSSAEQTFFWINEIGEGLCGFIGLLMILDLRGRDPSAP